jgi:group I intron endonuclease
LFGGNSYEETRAKMSASKMGSKHPEKTRAKMSASMKGKNNPMFGYIKKNTGSQPNSIKIEVTDLELDTKTIYNSIRAAAKVLNCHHSAIKYNLNSKCQKPYRNRYVIRKI